jgi:lactoylglutathione lyase
MSTRQARNRRDIDRQDLDVPADIERFGELIRASFEDAEISIDAPRLEGSEWWLDMVIKDFRLTLSWRAGTGFGLYLSGDGYGERPSEIYRKAELVTKRVKQLKASRDNEAGPEYLSLRDLRRLTGTAQKTLADALRIAQGGISRFENRPDIKLSTLSSYVEAMGGKLEIKVDFPDFAAVVGILPPQEETSSSRQADEDTSASTLNLIVIRAKEPRKLAPFYQAIGLKFDLEKHGSGPEHYTSSSEGSVFEIYPLEKHSHSTAATRLGFTVKHLHQVVEALKNMGGVIIKPPAMSKWGMRAVVQDPAGHKVELTEKS